MCFINLKFLKKPNILLNLKEKPDKSVAGKEEEKIRFSGLMHNVRMGRNLFLKNDMGRNSRLNIIY